MQTIHRAFQLSKLSYRILVAGLLSSSQDKSILIRKEIFKSFVDLGGVYVKFMQIAALNLNFLQGWAGPAEFKIFEATEQDDLDIIQVIKEELGDRAKQLLHIESLPFATGSFAQVYKARLDGGAEVVIKVMRPSLIKTLRADLRLLGFMVRVLSVVFPSTMVDARQAYSIFRRTTLAETDYATEVMNADWFYEYFKKNPNIVIPFTFAHLSTRRIIVQEYVAGMSIAEIMTESKAGGHGAAQVVQESLGSDLWVQMETLGTELLASTMLADYIPGDPHPGNIKLLPDNRVGLIDFGLVTTPAPDRIAFLNLLKQYKKLYNDSFDPAEFTRAAINFFDGELSSALHQLTQISEDYFARDIIDEMSKSAAERFNFNRANDELTQLYFRRKMIMRIFANGINEGNRFGIRVDTSAGIMLKAAHMYLLLMDSLSSGEENINAIRAALDNSVKRAEDQIGHIPPSSHRKFSNVDAIEFLSSWLSEVADSDPLLFARLVNSRGVRNA